jgi:hypothetical protein
LGCGLGLRFPKPKPKPKPNPCSTASGPRPELEPGPELPGEKRVLGTQKKVFKWSEDISIYGCFEKIVRFLIE